MRHTRRSRVEAAVAYQFRSLENNAAEFVPLTLVLNTEKDGFAIPALKGAIRRNCGVACTGARRRFSTVAREVSGITHPFRQRFEERNVDRSSISGPLTHE